MARRKAFLHVQKQNPNGAQNASTSPKGKVSVREYYNKRYEEVDKKQRSIGLYADTTNLHIAWIEGLWREYVTTCCSYIVVLADAISCLDTAKLSRSIRITRFGR